MAEIVIKEQKKTEKQKKFSVRKLGAALLLVLIPLTLAGAWKIGERNYYLTSLLIILYSMGAFFVSFERRRPQARELVTLAVMSAIAVASRAIFIMLPHFKPMVGIIMITGIALGAEAGFLTGAVSGFVSNFIFGQGPWTPWQMFAFGIAGLIAGLMARKHILSGDTPKRAAVVGAAVILFIVGPILDTCTVFTMSAMIDTSSLAKVYLAGLPLNGVFAVATALTLLLMCKPMTEKLDRIKVKYGMMEEGVDDAI